MPKTAPPQTPTFDFAQMSETALVASAAAIVASLIAVKLFGKKETSITYAPYPAPTYTTAPSALSQVPRSTYTVSSSSDDGEDNLQSRGWSMEEALNRAQEGSKKAKTMCPLEVLRSLQKGNSRFWTGAASRPEVSAFERRALIKMQFPSTAILGCSDSRVPVEIVFDQGLGDMFVVRVAGNCLGPTTAASVEYAVHHLHVKVLLVMGHEGCGAIKAAGLPQSAINNESAALRTVLTELKSGLDGAKHLNNIVDARSRDRECVAMNVRNQILKLCDDDQVLEKVNDGSLVIVGGFYEISSGIVDFFMQVSKDEDGGMTPSPGVQSRYNPKTKEIVYA